MSHHYESWMITFSPAIGDEHVYRYNKEKSLNWCTEKVIKIQKVLDERNMAILPGSRASTFVTTDVNSDEGN